MEEGAVTPDEATIRVAIVARVRLYREGLADAVRAEPGFEVAGIGSDTRAAADVVRRSEADVALIDLSRDAGANEVRSVRAADPGAKVVVLGIEEDEDHVLPLLEAGAAGYLTLDASLSDLFATLSSAVHDEALCSPRIVASLARRLARLSAQRSSQPTPASLTAREGEVLGLLDEGLSNKEIASRLCIELPTVKNHVHHILEKLQVHRRAEATARLRGWSQAENRSVV